jgi:hypothetical protein
VGDKTSGRLLRLRETTGQREREREMGRWKREREKREREKRTIGIFKSSIREKTNLINTFGLMILLFLLLPFSEREKDVVTFLPCFLIIVNDCLGA